MALQRIWEQCGITMRADAPGGERMKALVTGANGFLGRRIVRRLAVKVSRYGPGAARPQHRCRRRDFRGRCLRRGHRRGGRQGRDSVVHAAARVATTGGPWEAFAEPNIRGTRRVIRAAQGAGVRRIVHISSLGVYAVPRGGVTITEDSPYESESSARGHYSRSKLAADRLALSEAQRGAPVVVLRPGCCTARASVRRWRARVSPWPGVRLILASTGLHRCR